MEANKDWEQAFDQLNKEAFSAEAAGSYDFEDELKKWATFDSRILDFGCGKGHKTIELRKKGYKNVFGCDPSDLLLAPLINTHDYLKIMQTNKIPFADKSFDVVYCSGVLHHIAFDDLTQVMKEVRRVLKPGGIFLYVEPRKTFLRSLGHVVVMNKVMRVIPQVRHLADCLTAEWPTYQPWLERSDAEFVPICERAGFNTQKIEKRALTVVGVLKA